MRTSLNRRPFRHAAAALALVVTAGLAAGQEAAPGAGPPPGGIGRGRSGGQPGAAPAGAAPAPAGGGLSGGRAEAGGRGRAEAPRSRLEEMLEKALKNNPDLHVATAKVQEAQAELNRTRLEVTRKVIRLYASLDAARTAAEGGERRLTEVRQLAERNAISKEEVRTVEKEVAEAKAQLAAVEAESAYLLGEQSGPTVGTWTYSVPVTFTAPAPEGSFTQFGRQTMGVSGGSQPARGGLGGGMARQPGRGPTVVDMPRGKIADRVDEFLGLSMNADFKDVPLASVLKGFEKDYHIVFTLDGPGNGPMVNLHCDDMPIGNILQAIADTTHYEFVVRDYGILVLKEGTVPPGTVPLHTWWKWRLEERVADPNLRKDTPPPPPK